MFGRSGCHQISGKSCFANKPFLLNPYFPIPMKKISSLLLALLSVCTYTFAQCIDIPTESVVSYLNRELRPGLDLKLDKSDGFLAIKGIRQNFSVPEVSIKGIARDWTYNFDRVRRLDANFFFDSRTNSFALDVKFEDEGPEIIGTCPGCIKVSRDSRAPDIEWESPQILRIFLKPAIYQTGVALEVSDIRLIGEFNANGLGDIMLSLTDTIRYKLKQEIIALFTNGETQRIFHDALAPLLQSNGAVRPSSVTLASGSLRMCR